MLFASLALVVHKGAWKAIGSVDCTSDGVLPLCFTRVNKFPHGRMF